MSSMDMLWSGRSILRSDAQDIKAEIGGEVRVSGMPLDILLPFERGDVSDLVRRGDDLIIVLKDGRQTTINDFYLFNSELVLAFEGEQTVAPGSSAPYVLGAGGLALAALGVAAGNASDDEPEDARVVIYEKRIGGDGVVNASERSSGLTVTGETNPGATVEVELGGVRRLANVDQNGNWSAEFRSNEVPSGDQRMQVKAFALTKDNKEAQAVGEFEIDTLVSVLDTDQNIGGADGIINKSEAAEGVRLTGNVEPGSEVVIAISGQNINATVDNSGNWWVEIPESAIPMVNDGVVEVRVTGTDSSGNHRSVVEAITVDLVSPPVPDIKTVLRTDERSLEGVQLRDDLSDVSVDYISLVEDAEFVGVDYDTIPLPNSAGVILAFDAPVPDGSHLVVTASDAAGNRSGTYVVLSGPEIDQASTTVASNIGECEINVIDLEFMEDATLTLTEAQIVAITGEENTVKVLGNSDDSVRITGATRTGSVTEDGTGYSAYELGQATILIEDEITSVSTV